MKKKYVPIFLRGNKIFLTLLNLFLVFQLTTAFSVNTSFYVQETSLSLQLGNTTVQNVMEAIESQSEYIFFYQDQNVDLNREVNINLEEKRIDEILDVLFQGTSNTFRINDRQIILGLNESKMNMEDEKPMVRVSASPAPKNISGKVTDTSDEPILGATILVKGTDMGTITDLNGIFNLEVPATATTLVFSYLGMKSQEIELGDRILINVKMEQSVLGLDEVVAVGYGVVKKSNLTGAIASVKMEDIPPLTTNNVSNALMGQVSGLSVRQTSAAPGGGYDMVIRGSASTGAGNAPLYVIDGFPGGDINTINPGDIESIEVLKDASATAIYGARAANGVILINTKTGKTGKMEITVNTSISAQTISKPYDMVSAKDYMEMSNAFFHEEWMYKSKIAPYGDVDPSTVTSSPKIAFSPEEIANATNVTDWFNEITRTGLVNQENVSIKGGEENVRYLFSLGHLGHKGVVINSGVEQFLGRLNLELDLSDWLTTGVTVSTSQNTVDEIAQASSPNGKGMIRDAMMYPQYLPVFDEDGNYTINPDHSTTANPVSWKDVQDRTKTYRTLVNNFWQAQIIPGLSFRANWGVSSAFSQNSYFVPKTHLQGIELNTYASLSEQRKFDYLLDATLTYSKEIFNNHHLKAMAGYGYQKFNTEYVYASNSDFLTDVFGPWNLAAGGDLTKSVSSSKSMTKYLSYFGRINYDIADKYLFTFTIRADGSDKFGEDNKFGYFPSGAFAWRVTEEGFMKNQHTITNLKLRASLGQTGNSQIGGNTYGFYSTGANYVLGNTLVTGVSENQLSNPGLKWETTTEYNIGLDWALFRDRLSGSFEYYNKVISDLLDTRPVGSYYPVDEVADNLGKTQSKGVELQIRSININSNDFMWTTTLNLFKYQDSWKERNPFSILSIYQGQTDPLHVSYGYQSDGLIQEGEEVAHMPDAPAGSIKVRDLNGWLKDENDEFILDANGNKKLSGEPDNAIDDADKTIILNSAPELNFGLGNTFTYRGFDLTLFFYGEIGRQLNNITRMDFMRADKFRFFDNVTTESNDRWSSENKEGIYPSGLYPVFESNTDFYIEKADFLRLKNLTLGYTFPAALTKGVFKSARLYVDIQNLFVLTNYTGSDPETDGFSAYPNQRTYSCGVNLSF